MSSLAASPHGTAGCVGPVAAVLCLLWASGCSDATHTVGTLPDDFERLGGGQGGRSANVSSGGDGDGDQGVQVGSGGNANPGPIDDEPKPIVVDGAPDLCDYTTSPARIDVSLIVDTYITLPLTGSLERALNGIRDYVDDPRSAGSAAGAIFVRTVCERDAYDPPDAPMGLLPGNSQTITDAFPATTAATVAPMTPALESAVAQARARAVARPERKQIAVIVTDALSFGTSPCGFNESPLEEVARDAFEGTPSIPVYVVQLSLDGPGIPILPDTPLETTAAAGGSGIVRIASLVQADSMAETLAQVRTESQPCAYTIPADVTADQAQLVLNYGTSPVDRVDDAAACGSSPSAFYYDDNAAPTRVVACPATCDRIRGAGRHESVRIRGTCP